MSGDLAIGVDIGASNTRAAIVARAGTLLTRRACRTVNASGEWPSPEELVALVATLVREVQADTGHAALPVGVGSVGQIDRQTGRLLGTTLADGRYEDFPLRLRLEQVLGGAVCLDNDAKVAGLGELRCGAGRPFQDLIYLGVGTGIGGALICDGRLVHGARGLAGHLGLISIDWRGPVYPSRIPGPLEGLASGTGIARLGAMHGLGVTGALTSERVFAAAQAGDACGIAALDDAARALGVGIASLLHAFNPQAVIIGGGVSQTGAAFLRQVAAAVAENTMPAFAGAALLPAALGADSGLIGAAIQVWES